MAIQDYYGFYDTAHAITATADSENIINHGIGVDEWGDSKAASPNRGNNRLMLVGRIPTGFSTGGSQGVSLQADLYHATTSACGTKMMTLMASTYVSQLTEGKSLFKVGVPEDMLQYSKITWTVTGGTLDTGTVDAWIGLSASRDL